MIETEWILIILKSYPKHRKQYGDGNTSRFGWRLQRNVKWFLNSVNRALANVNIDRRYRNWDNIFKVFTTRVRIENLLDFFSFATFSRNGSDVGILSLATRMFTPEVDLKNAAAVANDRGRIEITNIHKQRHRKGYAEHLKNSVLYDVISSKQMVAFAVLTLQKY